MKKLTSILVIALLLVSMCLPAGSTIAGNETGAAAGDSGGNGVDNGADQLVDDTDDDTNVDDDNAEPQGNAGAPDDTAGPDMFLFADEEEMVFNADLLFTNYVDIDWDDAGILALSSAGHFAALERLVNRFYASAPNAAAELADFNLFFPDLTEIPADPTELEDLYTSIDSGVFKVTSNITISNVLSIGTAAHPFKGAINGQTFLVKYQVSPTGAAALAPSIFGTVEDAYFYRFSIENTIQIANSASDAVLAAGLIATSLGSTRLENVRTSGVYSFAVLPGAVVRAPYVANGTFASVDNISTLEYDGAMPAVQSGKLLIKQMSGFSVYVYGNTVTKVSNFEYDIPAGATVRIVAVNETREFSKWVIAGSGTLGSATTYSTTLVMPSNGTGVSLGCEKLALNASTGLPNPGRTFATAYTLDDAADMLAFQNAVSNTAVAADLERFKPDGGTTPTAALLRSGYFQVTGDITIPGDGTPYLGAGNSTGGNNSFKGFLDGANPDTGENYSITFELYGNNTAAYGGLFGYIGGGVAAYAVIRNIDLYGEFTPRGATATSYYGSVAGYANYGIFDNINAGVKIISNDNKAHTYVGGLVGLAQNSYFVDCTYLGQTKLECRTSDTGAYNVYLGGLFGKLSNTIVEDSHAVIAEELSVSGVKTYGPSSLIAVGGPAGTVEVGGLTGMAESTVSPFGLLIRNCTVRAGAADDAADKSILASVGKAGFAYASSLVGYASVSKEAVFENCQVVLNPLCKMSVIASDIDSKGGDTTKTYVGGMFGLISNGSFVTVIADAGSLPFEDIAAGGLELSAINYGRGTENCAGGISGKNICLLDKLNGGQIDLSGLTIQVIQKFSATVTADAPSYVGGVVGYPQASAKFDNLTVTGKNTSIKMLRESGSALTGAIYVGGVAGLIPNAAYEIRNLRCSFEDGLIDGKQNSYSSAKGNTMVGGVFGSLAGSTKVYDSSFTAKGTTNINGVTCSMYAGHGTSDIYVGGFAGYTGSGAGVQNCTVTGNYAGNASPTISIVANQSSNSPCIGGIVGFSHTSEIARCTVDNVYIYGEAYNKNADTLDTDVIVGGIAGLTNNSSSTATNFAMIANCVVQNSKIEALGREYTLTYAAGVLGASFTNPAKQGTVENCVSQNNHILVRSQKKWAAGGGIMGYAFDTTTNIYNCGSFGDVIEVYSTGDRTTGTRTFDAISIAGGILGKVNAPSSLTVRIYNCYSNAQLQAVNPNADLIYKGGLVGYKAQSVQSGASLPRLFVYNSFFHEANAGSNIAVDMAKNAGTTVVPMEGSHYYSTAEGVMPSSAPTETTAELVTTTILQYSALNFDTIYLSDDLGTNPAKILSGILPDGQVPVQLAGAQPALYANATVTVTPTPAAATGWLATPLDGTRGYLAELNPTAPATQQQGFAHMRVFIIGPSGTKVPYVFDDKPILSGPAREVDTAQLFVGDSLTGTAITTGTAEFSLFCGDSPLQISAGLIYTGETQAEAGPVVWQFSRTGTFPPAALSVGAVSDIASVRVKDNLCTIDPSLLLYNEGSFWLRAVSVEKNALGHPVSTLTVKITVKPHFVTGVIINEAELTNDFTSYQFISSKTITTLTSRILPEADPDDPSVKPATVQTKSYVGYKVKADGTIDDTKALDGVRSDGTIFPSEMLVTNAISPAGKVNLDDIFVVFAISDGRADPDATLYPGCTVTAKQCVQSKPMYMRLGADVKVNVQTRNAQVSVVGSPTAGKFYEIVTYPINSNMSDKPIEAYYMRGTTKIDIPMDSDAGHTKSGLDEVYYTYDPSTKKSTIRLFIPDGKNDIDVYIPYYSSVTLRYLSPSGDLITSKVVPEFVSKADLLYMGDDAVNMPAAYQCYTLAGWYHIVSSKTTDANQIATLGTDYTYPLLESYIDDTDPENPIFKNLIDSGGSDIYNVYARFQYKVTVLDSAAADGITCRNVDANETARTDAPVNSFSNYTFSINVPSWFAGTPQCAVWAGTTRLVEGVDYFENNGRITINSSSIKNSQLGTTGITIQPFHVSGVLIPEENDTFAGTLRTVPGDGIFTYAFSVNHAVKTITTDSGPVTLKTYAFENPAALNEMLMSFTPTLPAGTLIEIHRAVQKNVPEAIYWYKTTAGDSTTLSIDQFHRMGTTSTDYTPVAFDSYLNGKTGYAEQYFIVIKPPTYTGQSSETLADNTVIRVGFNNVTTAYLDDAQPMFTERLLQLSGLQTPSFSVTGNKGSGTVTFSAGTAPSNNVRHNASIIGVSFSFVKNGQVVLLDSNVKITANGVSVQSTAPKPISTVFFRATPGSFTYSIQNAPADAELRIEFIEVNDQCFGIEPGEAVPRLKLENGEVRYSKSFAG